MKPKFTPTAKIMKKNDGIWMMIDSEDGNVAWSIEEDEVGAILRACMEYLSKKKFLLDEEVGEL